MNRTQDEYLHLGSVHVAREEMSKYLAQKLFSVLIRVMNLTLARTESRGVRGNIF